jgi:hypothetical protein
MSEEYVPGRMIQRPYGRYLVTRVVRSSSYFEDWRTHETYILHERYVETLDEEGRIKFIQLEEVREPVTKEEDAILGPDTLEWKRPQGVA